MAGAFAIDEGSIGPAVGAVWHSPDDCSPQPHASQPRLSRRRLCRCVRPVFAPPANLVNGVTSEGRINELFRILRFWRRTTPNGRTFCLFQPVILRVECARKKNPRSLRCGGRWDGGEI